MNKPLHEHFRPDERPFIDKALEWVERAAGQHAVKRTDFLDPRQSFILSSLANRAEVNLRLDGGYDGAERRRAIITPDYRNADDEDTGIRVLSVTPADTKFAALEHGDYMGAILGLGIKRDKIGDIHVLENGCHILVAAEISDYFDLHLKQVHRVHVHTDILPLETLQVSQVSMEEIGLSVASLRLDGIVGDVWHLSRAKALVPIKAGRCRVNWKTEEDPSRPLKDGDVVSLQGFGRFKVLETEGLTKKGRVRIRVGKYT